MVEILRDDCKQITAYKDIAHEMISPSMNCTHRVYLQIQKSH